MDNYSGQAYSVRLDGARVIWCGDCMRRDEDRAEMEARELDGVELCDLEDTGADTDCRSCGEPTL